MNLGEIPKRIITEEDNLSVCRVNNASFEGGNCIKINAARNQTGFFVDGLIQCTALTWKVDTGAKKTFITEEVFYEIPPENRPVLEPARRKFATASGHSLNILGTAYMTLNFDDFEVDFRVFVGGVTQNLLGEDFYTKFKCNWDHENGGIIAKVSDEDESCRRSNWIRTSETLSLSPGHEAVIQSVLSYPENEVGIPLVSSNFRQTHGLLIARTLLDANEDIVYLRIFNPGMETVTVKCNENIALFSPVIGVTNSKCEGEAEVNLVAEVDPVNIPEHLVHVFDDGRVHLSDEETMEFEKFLQERAKTFADPKGKPGRTTLGKHHIVLNDNQPFKEASRNMPLFKREVLDKEVKRLEDLGIIEKSQSPWSSQIVLVQKKDKSWRVCVDYRRLNTRTIKDAYPIPRIDDNLDALSGSMWFTSLDLDMAYQCLCPDRT